MVVLNQSFKCSLETGQLHCRHGYHKPPKQSRWFDRALDVPAGIPPPMPALSKNIIWWTIAGMRGVVRRNDGTQKWMVYLRLSFTRKMIWNNSHSLRTDLLKSSCGSAISEGLTTILGKPHTILSEIHRTVAHLYRKPTNVQNTSC